MSNLSDFLPKLPPATQAEMEAGTQTAYRSMSPALVAASVVANAPDPSVGDLYVTVHTGNGHGSTNSAIRRFTTTASSSGSAITYADSATLGASFTINEPGLYAIRYTDASTGGSSVVGVSVNAASLAIDITSFQNYDASAGSSSSPEANKPATVSCVVRLFAGDVVRPHNGTGRPNVLTQSLDSKFERWVYDQATR